MSSNTSLDGGIMHAFFPASMKQASKPAAIKMQEEGKQVVHTKWNLVF